VKLTIFYFIVGMLSTFITFIVAADNDTCFGCQNVQSFNLLSIPFAALALLFLGLGLRRLLQKNVGSSN